MKYYFLVSYLPEVHPDDRKIRVRVADLLDEMDQFSEEDRRQIELVLLAGDVLQIEHLLSGKDVEISPQLFGRGFWKEQIQSPKEVLEEFAPVLEQLLLEGPSPKNLGLLYEAYYAYAIDKASGGFLPAYLRFERDLRNIMAAVRARRKGLPPSDHLVGEGEVVDALERSTAEDFGLSVDYPWIERLIAAKEPQEMQEIMERIIWENLEEMTESLDFDFDIILAYLLKLQILEKGLALSEKQGMEILKQLEEF